MNLPCVILIGGSAGSVNALQTLLKSMSPDFQIPMVVVQHLAAGARIHLDLVYGPYTKMKMIEITDKVQIEDGHIYFAPTGYHTLVERDFSLSLSQDDLVHFSRPSIEVFFESAAISLGNKCAAILMTGANEDGGEGLCLLNAKGALTFVQDPKTAEVPVMPQSALKPGYHHQVLPLAQIANRLSALEKREVHV